MTNNDLSAIIETLANISEQIIQIRSALEKDQPSWHNQLLPWDESTFPPDTNPPQSFNHHRTGTTDQHFWE